ncbi:MULTISPECIES: hypothetical protein [Pseudomonas]|uniref:hypothetical protein n=1 Tax=Pseudomonas TaxID=286 RepID=UPI0013DECE9C|nr:MULTISPECIES: hypothetical protein [Pseudomonas]MCE0912619.1 hypothetical protein [Pseudomonas kurunegalensis]MDD2027044.1 hypothetical protein [Pseudomonas putida]QIG19374.1 hypothetical protein FY041_17300 [Pseudomonas monteilii]QIG24629.1 hypothetical protein FY043_17295 [Pseudomonas monteilii]WJR54072.1 hypothetical protein LU664_017055 [Pseudomonas kurunegalensis]
MTEVHRYKAVKMLSEAGNRISYDPQGPYVVMAEAYDQLKAESEALRKEAERNKRMLLDACVNIGSIGEALGLDMNADADMMIGTARDLIDGLNRIIKECPLGSPGFAIATEVMGELGVQQEDES